MFKLNPIVSISVSCLLKCVQFYYTHRPAVISGTVDMLLLTNHKASH